MVDQRLTREAVAHIEIGSTAISKLLSWLLSCVFLLTVFLVPIVQYQIENHGSQSSTMAGWSFLFQESEGTFVSRITSKNTQFLERLDQLETNVEENSFLRSFFLPPLQKFYLDALGQGNEKVVVGDDGWLFFRPGVDSLSGPAFLDKEQLQSRVEGHELWEKSVQPDPVKAIVDFKNQLSRRGIQLIVLPVPVKPSVHAEQLSGYNFTAPPVNRDWTNFLKKLVENDVTVFDSRSFLYDYAQKYGAAFLKTDTHWLPGAMDLVASELATRVLSYFPELESSTNFTLQQQVVEAEGDVARMLTLPQTNESFLQSVTVEQVVSGGNELWLPATDSEILLLGDSFTNIYSTVGLGWGRSGGFAEHLSYHLQYPVDVLSRNDSGAFVTREMLGLELARGRDRLAGKKVVIWEFAERELTHGDWKMIDLSLGTPPESGFLVIESGQQIDLQGIVAAVSKSPRPGSVPYRDNLLTVHLVDLKGKKDGLTGDQALIYVFGMKDNELTDFAGLRPGDQIDITLSAWEDVEGDYGSYRRSPLDDEMIELELPNWGTLNNDKKN
ncbi:MAG: hypothetical protein ACI8ZB_000274 [Desulforhopalus sp.]|jgi:hypothetical protein